MSVKPKGFHRIFLKHLCVLSECQDINNVTSEWLVGEIRLSDSDECRDEILECIKSQKLPDIDLLLSLNGNLTVLPNRCICGVKIREHCLTINVKTNHQIWVGNCCVKHIDADIYEKNNTLLNCLHSIMMNGIDYVGNKLNDNTKTMFIEKGVLNVEDVEFLNSIGKKRNLSEKRKYWLRSIKSKILRHYCHNAESKLSNTGVNVSSICTCGNEKSPEYDECIKCHKLRLYGSDICKCGKKKSPGFENCWSCHNLHKI